MTDEERRFSLPGATARVEPGVGAGVTISDLSCCLFMAGETQASSGIYSPLAYHIRPRGDDLAEHHVMHLHEIHHKALNDDTAWGALIHIAARHPGWAPELLSDLVASCRTVHEAFASFMSISLARTRHDDVDRVLNRYPIYLPLARRIEKLLVPVIGSHRRELAATGIARWCMSAPVFDHVLDAYPRIVSLREIPSEMRPDHRFRVLAGMAAADLVGRAAESADRAFEAAYGHTVDSLVLTETDNVLDSAWGAWEEAFVRALVSSIPQLASLRTLQTDAHLGSAAALVRAADARGIFLQLPHEVDEHVLSDVESVQRLLRATTLTIRDTPYRGALAILGQEVDLEPVLAQCEASTRSHIVIHGRRTADLTRMFRFSTADLVRLQELGTGPVFAIRSLVDHDGDEAIVNTEIAGPDIFAEVVAAWEGRGVAAVCVTTSCYLDTEWQHEWLPALRAWPIVVLVDMGLATMTGRGSLLGSEERVYGTYLGLGRDDVMALAWHVDGHPHVMLALGDDLTLQLVAGQLRDLLGERVGMDDSDWSQWLDVLAAVASNVLATEPALRYDAGCG